jgi:hypothetical protein
VRYWDDFLLMVFKFQFHCLRSKSFKRLMSLY